MKKYITRPIAILIALSCFCLLYTSDIKEKGWSLTPGAYVGVVPREDDGVDFVAEGCAYLCKPEGELHAGAVQNVLVLAEDGLGLFRAQPAGSIAVSYTHLDVYKRQAWRWSMEACDILQPLEAALCFNPGGKPVSYTHLDVYKRQGCTCGGR